MPRRQSLKITASELLTLAGSGEVAFEGVPAGGVELLALLDETKSVKTREVLSPTERCQ